MPNENEQFDTLPPAIIDALRELDGPAVMPDVRHDADVFSGARQHLAQIHRKNRNLRLFFAGSIGGALAAAAMVGIVVYLGNPPGNAEQERADLAMKESVPTFTQTAEPGDIDHSGSVDILDAYALARQIEQGQASKQLDLNRDGSIDQRDIDLIVGQAISLNPGDHG